MCQVHYCIEFIGIMWCMPQNTVFLSGCCTRRDKWWLEIRIHKHFPKNYLCSLIRWKLKFTTRSKLSLILYANVARTHWSSTIFIVLLLKWIMSSIFGRSFACSYRMRVDNSKTKCTENALDPCIRGLEWENEFNVVCIIIINAHINSIEEFSCPKFNRIELHGRLDDFMQTLTLRMRFMCSQWK